ncbi:hypothetical protein BDZ89DRAFT_1051169 [Hymenopellis radicata]|nr:hypothetical protein BDZ89DRAFT_1051169 [Hymenopellis radicata]
MNQWHKAERNLSDSPCKLRFRCGEELLGDFDFIGAITMSSFGASSCPSCGAENIPSNPQSLLPFPIDFPAAFPHYFSHNDALSELDTEGFKQNVITPATANLSAVTSEAARLRSTLAALEREEARLRSALDGYHLRISAFRRFPPEVLAEIFHWCSISSSNMLSTKKGRLWVVGQRRAASQASSGASHTPDSFPAPAAPPICPPWLRELMGVSHRWHNLYLSCSLAILDDLGAIYGRLDSLQSLTLRLNSDYASAAAHRQIDLETHVFRAFEVAPHLREAELDQACCNIALPLGQLKSVKHAWFIADNSDFRHSSLTRLHSLAHCSSLVELRLVTRIEDVAPPTAMPPAMMIRLDSLCTLHLSDYHILDSIDCRNLEVLRFALRRSDGYGDPDTPYFDAAAALTAVLGLLARCYCDIKVFAIPEIQVDSVERFLDVLRAVPFLDTLELDYFRWCAVDAVYKSFDEGLQKIIPELDYSVDDPIIPRLRALSITIDNLSNQDDGCRAYFIDEQFYNLVSTRMRIMALLRDTERGTREVGGRGLDHVKIDIRLPMKLDSTLVVGMRWLKRYGFDMSIVTRTARPGFPLPVADARDSSRLIHV